MKGLLSATLAATLLGTVGSLAQSASLPQPNSASGLSKLSQSPNDPRLASDAAAQSPQQTIVPKPAELSKPDDGATQPTPGENNLDQRRLTDPKTGCTALVPQSVQADDMTWPGVCEAGLISGRGTISFSNNGRFSESLTGEFAKGGLRDGQIVIRWADGSHYEGNAIAANMQGAGTLTTAAGDKFEGQWAAGLLNGKGVAIWANGDRYDGEWRDGKAEGQGVQDWADGRQYSGLWRDDQPNGHGIIRRKDGTRLEGEFVNGQSRSVVQLAVASGADTISAPPIASSTAKAGETHVSSDGEAIASADPNSPQPAQRSAISGIAGKKLVAVDGSSLTLTTVEDGLTREIVAPNGNVKKNVFSFLGDRVGSVSEGDDTDNVTGVFRLTDKGIITNYSDGRSEELYPNNAGGVSMMLNAPTGQTYCMAWYPEGHRFTLDERKAALAAYASKLGLDEPQKKAAKPVSKPSCSPLADAQPAPAVSLPGHPSRSALRPTPRPNPHGAKTGLLLRRDLAPAGIMTASFSTPTSPPANQRLPDQVIEVRPSTVHLIDSDQAPDAAGAQNMASIGPGNVAKSASACLSVESDGQHWSFHNHCGFDVQFAYCLMNAADPLAACDKGGVTGSVAPNGASALVPDRGLSEKDADHDFRWVACGGGAGEVAVHLDQAEPPTGRCVKTGAS